MAAETQRPLYDVSALKPAIEAGTQLLTPNRRLARRIKLEWDRERIAAGDRAWAPLSVEALEPWLLSCWQRRCVREPALRRILISPGQELLLWREIILKDQQAGAYQLLQSEAAARLAQQARDALLRYQVSIEEASVRQAFSLAPDCAAFTRWLDAFEQTLQARGLASTLDVINLLACSDPLIETDVALLVEFDELPPLLARALARQCGQTDRLQARPARSRNQLLAFASPREELAAAARWARQTFDAEPEARLGIVLTDMHGDRARLEYLLRREFECLDAPYASLPVNFSSGWALAESPVIRDALAVLDLLQEPIAINRVLQIQRSRFVELPDRYSPESMAWTRRLYEQRRRELTLSTLRHLAVSSAGQGPAAESPGLIFGERLLKQASERHWRKVLCPSEWMQILRTQLEAWGWPGNALDSLEYQQVEHFYRLMDELAGYDGLCDAVPLGEALALLRRASRDTMFQPKTADSRVQVLGPLEAAGLQFDYLWVLGMQASQWPAPARPNPLLPIALQREARMPHASAEREWEYASALLTHYQRACGTLLASYSRDIDGAPDLPSALLGEFPCAQPPQAELVPGRWREAQLRGQRECCEDELAPEVGPQELADIRGGSGLLEDQSNCPFRAFARRRLDARPLPEPVLAPDAATRGQLVHDALFALWGELGDLKQLLALDDQAREGLIQRCARTAIESLDTGLRMRAGKAWCQQEQRHLQYLLAEWLDIESQRGEFVVEARESEHQLTLEGLTLKLRVDRIDRLPDGRRLLIDYKTGSPALREWLGERPEKPQLPLYSLTEGAPVAAVAYARLRPRHCEYLGLGSESPAPGIKTEIPDSEIARDWEELLLQWQLRLERLMKEFIQGQAAVEPLATSSCAWCGLEAVCRISVDTDAHTVGRALNTTQEQAQETER